eukprot:scaffold955_cov325-Prasinococcus_capsulatus_cf.AAC.5
MPTPAPLEYRNQDCARLAGHKIGCARPLVRKRLLRWDEGLRCGRYDDRHHLLLLWGRSPLQVTPLAAGP